MYIEKAHVSALFIKINSVICTVGPSVLTFENKMKSVPFLYFFNTHFPPVFVNVSLVREYLNSTR